MLALRNSYHHTVFMAKTSSICDLRGAWNEKLRKCDHPDCNCGAEYKAPKSREQLREYYWFCLEHVREYNRSWNFYAGMNQREIEAEMRHDTVWQRPTWPLGAHKDSCTRFDYRISTHEDQFEFFSKYTNSNIEGDPNYQRFAADTPEGRALAVMDLDVSLTLTSLKSQYKKLVKRLHPDTNGGDTAAEERLKEINDAYETLQKAVST